MDCHGVEWEAGESVWRRLRKKNMTRFFFYLGPPITFGSFGFKGHIISAYIFLGMTLGPTLYIADKLLEVTVFLLHPDLSHSEGWLVTRWWFHSCFSIIFLTFTPSSRDDPLWFISIQHEHSSKVLPFQKTPEFVQGWSNTRSRKSSQPFGLAEDPSLDPSPLCDPSESMQSRSFCCWPLEIWQKHRWRTSQEVQRPKFKQWSQLNL